MGVVWRARDQIIGREIALKELRMPPGLDAMGQRGFLDRVLREARTAGVLNDPGVVTVYDIVSDGGATYIAMELVLAPTLTEVVGRSGPLLGAQVRDLALGLLSALEAAHAAGIVHRDVKPSNVMVLPNGRVKLADFGIARGLDDPALTATGGIMGSPGYLAPELFRGSAPVPASDLWALGATLFFAVEGRAPFERDNTAATLHAIMYEYPQLERCGGPLAEAIMGLLDQSAETRLAAADVRRILSGEPELATRSQAPAPGEDFTQALPRDEPRTSFVPPTPPPPLLNTRSEETPWHNGFGGDPIVQAKAASPSWEEDWTPRKGLPKKPVLAVLATLLVMASVGTVLYAVNKSRPAEDTAAAVTTTQLAVPTDPSLVATSSELPSATSSVSLTTTQSSSAAATTTKVTLRPGKLPPGAPTSRIAVTHLPSPNVPVVTAEPKSNWVFINLTRYANAATLRFTTVPEGDSAPPGFGFNLALGSLVTTPEPGTMSLYACKVTTQDDWFTSLQSDCEGQTKLDHMGYIFGNPPHGVESVALYRCNTGGSHADDLTSNCQGYTVEGRLGYLVKR
jgi:serine/threonine protein kinase